MEDAAIYARGIRARLPEVLGRMDRDRFSPTHGCMDRTFWAWKFTDFAGARFQEGLCALSYAWSGALGDDELAHNERLLDWIAGGFTWWRRIQHASGVLDEAYPFEASLAATAFTGHYLGEARGFLDGALPPAVEAEFREGMALAGRWLVDNDETHGFLSNHLSAAATALLHAWRVTGEDLYEHRARHFLQRILDHQSDEGWYDEYGGADPGYQTHGSYYLARAAELTDDAALAASLRASLDRACAFLAHCVHPDRSLGGEYASRNTQTYYPAAFEMLACDSGSAAWIADEMRPAVESLSAAGLGSVDAWNLFPLLNNAVFAHRAVVGRARPVAAPAPPAPEDVHFPGAGLVRIRRERYDAIVGTHKGGVVKVFDNRTRTLAFSDCGYVGRLKGGARFSSQWLEPGREVEVATDSVRVTGRFYQTSRPVMRPLEFGLFRLFSCTVGRWPAMARWVKGLLVKALIHKKRELDLSLERRIRFLDDGIAIDDALRGGLGERIDELVRGDAFTTIHMGSSRYFVPHELEPARVEPAEFLDPVPADRLAAGVTRSARVRLG